MIKSIKTVVSFLWSFRSFFKGRVWIFWSPLVFSLVVSLSESLSPYILKLVINELSLIDDNELIVNWQSVFFYGYCYIFLTGIVNLMFRFRDYFKLKILPCLKEAIILNAFDHLMNKPYQFFLTISAGDLVNRLMDVTRCIEALLNMVIDIFMWRLFSLVVASFSIYFISPYLTILLLTWSFVFIGISCYLSLNIKSSVQNYSLSRDNLFAQINDSLNGVINIFLFRGRGQENKIISSALRDHKRKEHSMLSLILGFGCFQGLLATLFTAAVFLLLLYLIRAESITSGDFTFVIIVSNTMMRNAYSISFDLVQLHKEVHLMNRFIKMLDQKIIEEENSNSLHINQGEVTFRDVSFGYTEKKFLFERKSLVIKGGQKIGIVGRSGAGKSTFVNLLLKLYELNEGQILIDGQDISKVSIDSLRKNISVIYQDPILFNRTILENVCYGSLHATNEEVVRVMRKVQLHEFVMALPQGYNTLVGDRGATLSGGQKQRIALARVLLSQSPIIVMDEPTSAIDPLTELFIQRSMDSLFTDKTVIVIAHKLKSVQNLDRVLVFDQGRIVADGSHEHLSKHSYFYQKLFNSENNIEKADNYFLIES